MGYDRSRFNGEILNNLTCMTCSNVLCLESQEDDKGHVFCYDCVSKWISNTNVCPIGCEILNENSLKPIQTIVKSILSDMKLSCCFNSNGCNEVLRMSDLNNHELRCPHRYINCFNGCKILLKEMKTHNCKKDLENVIEQKDAEIRDLIRRLKEVETERDMMKNELKNTKKDLVIKEFTSNKNPTLAPKENNQQKESEDDIIFIETEIKIPKEEPLEPEIQITGNLRGRVRQKTSMLEDKTSRYEILIRDLVKCLWKKSSANSSLKDREDLRKTLQDLIDGKLTSENFLRLFDIHKIKASENLMSFLKPDNLRKIIGMYRKTSRNHQADIFLRDL